MLTLVYGENSSAKSAFVSSLVEGNEVLRLEYPEARQSDSTQRKHAESMMEKVLLGADVCVETHSEIWLAVAQLFVAQQRLRPEKVEICWVEEGAVRAGLDEKGRLVGDFPIGAFSALLDLKGALLGAWRKTGQR